MQHHLYAMSAVILTAAVNTLDKFGELFGLPPDESCELIYTALKERRGIGADDVERLLSGHYKPDGGAPDEDKGPAADEDAPAPGAPTPE